MEINVHAVAYAAFVVMAYWCFRTERRWPMFLTALLGEGYAVFTSYWFGRWYAPLVVLQAPVVLAFLAWVMWGRRAAAQ